MAQWMVKNIVCSAKLNRSLDVQKVLKLFPNATHKPRQFPSICIKRLSGRTTCLVFKSGKLVTVGSRKESEAFEAMTILTEKLQILKEKQAKFELCDFTVQNIVASGQFPSRIRIHELHAQHLKETYWEPTVFPGLEYHHGPATLVVFHSGRYFVTGAKMMHQIEAAVSSFQKIAEKFYISPQT